MAIRISTGLADALAGGGAGDGSLKDILANAVAAVYSGSQPVNADAAETGTLLGYITKDGGSFTPGSATNGLAWIRHRTKRPSSAHSLGATLRD